MSDHCEGQKFFNPHTGRGLKTIWDVLRWRLFAKRIPWPATLDDVVPHAFPTQVPGSKVAVTFVGHDTFLLQYPGGVNMLTDPVWSERASPFTWLGPQRVRRPGIAFEDLPRIHAVLISHNHYDHLDRKTLGRLARHKPKVLVPLKNRVTMGDLGLDVIELDWWDRYMLGDLRITLTPAQHWSNRLIDRNRALWGGFWIDGPPSLFFAGDTGYRQGLFSEIRERLGTPDVSLLPMGTYEPREFMNLHHMNPDDAVLAHIDLDSRQSIGMHFGTFHLSDEAIDAPLRETQEALEKHGIPLEKFRVPHFGETLVF